MCPTGKFEMSNTWAYKLNFDKIRKCSSDRVKEWKNEPKFMFKGLKINFFRFFLRAFERVLRNEDISNKPKEFDQFV